MKDKTFLLTFCIYSGIHFYPSDISLIYNSMMILHLFKIIYFVTETKMNHPLKGKHI